MRLENHLPAGMALADANQHGWNDQPHGAEGKDVDGNRADPGNVKEHCSRFDQQLGSDSQVAEVHDADVEPAHGQVRFPEHKAYKQQ